MLNKAVLIEALRYAEKENIIEVNGGYLYNDKGKYASGITFVFRENENAESFKYAPFCKWTNLTFGGEPEVMWGSFWTSKKGSPCFAPAAEKSASHALIKVHWGGTTGLPGSPYKRVPEGVVFYRRKSSNAGGCGTDYWVIPVGYHFNLWVEEVDGGEKPTNWQEFTIKPWEEYGKEIKTVLDYLINNQVYERKNIGKEIIEANSAYIINRKRKYGDGLMVILPKPAAFSVEEAKRLLKEHPVAPAHSNAMDVYVTKGKFFRKGENTLPFFILCDDATHILITEVNEFRKERAVSSYADGEPVYKRYPCSNNGRVSTYNEVYEISQVHNLQPL